MKILFIIKGTIRNKTTLIDGIGIIFNDMSYQIAETNHPTHAVDLTQNYANKYSHIIAIGGDGTLNEVVNGVLKSNTLPIVGYFPAGTANDYSASVSCPDSLKNLKESIKYGRTKNVFIGKGEFIDMHGFPAMRYFINIADIGIGGEVVQRVNNDKSTISANLKFFKNILITFFSYKSHNVQTVINTKEINEKMLSLVVAKGKYFGSKLGIAPYADPEKNELYIVKIGDISVFEYLKKIPQLKQGKVIKHKDIQYFKTNALEVKTETPAPIDMDGEFVGYTPVNFSTFDIPIKFIVN